MTTVLIASLPKNRMPEQAFAESGSKEGTQSMNTYRKITAITTTTRILNHLADQQEPSAGKQIAQALDIAHGTIMCHLATLESANYVQRVGEHFEIGQALAMIWARKKASLQSIISRTNNSLNQLEV